MDPYITVKEAAALLDCCEETIRRMIRDRKIPAVRLGRTYRMRLKHLLPAEDMEDRDELLGSPDSVEELLA
jgi:excisionase family DNA binding protein